jgi:imidazolonepropionase-like amidohydrolase
LGLALLAACGQPPGAGLDALTGATVIDVVTGRSLPAAVILVRDGHVVAVGDSEEVAVPRGARVTDLSGRWIIPGLIDAHVHLQPWAIPLELHYGVTTVRDLHDGEPLADTLRAIASRSPSPRLFMAIAMLDVPPTTYPDAIPVASPDSAAAAVARAQRLGATWIKVYTHATPDVLGAIINAARVVHLPVAVHLGLTDAVTAANLGVTSIEHLSGIPEAAGDSVALDSAHTEKFFRGWTAFEHSWAGLDTVALTRVIEELAARRVYLVPTLVLHETFAHLDDSATYHPPGIEMVPDTARRNWNVPGMIRRAGWTADDYTAFRAARPIQDQVVRTFVAAGGRIAAGTDASNQLLVPGSALHSEMALLVHAGLTPLDALRSATSWSADLLGADSLGRLRAGAVADLVVLGGDPLADIANTRKVVRVMLGGAWVGLR